MSVTITVRDETTSGGVNQETPLEFPSERISVRELIRARVYQEVQDSNRKPGEKVFRGLVQPVDAERVLIGSQSEYQLKAQIDWKPQFDKAVQAFERNGFFILVDDLQAESLDQEFDIDSETEVRFVRLMMLQGG